MINESELLKQIHTLESSKNDGRGVGAIKTLLMYYEQGDKDSAKAVLNNEGDKIRNHMDIVALLIKLIPETRDIYKFTLEYERKKLVEYIQDLNEKARIWESEGKDRWASKLVEDPAHWEEYGILTKDQLGDYLDACCHKDCTCCGDTDY